MDIPARDSAASSEHQRLYMFVDQLTSPVRLALLSDETPPILSDYGELEEVGRGGMGIVYRSTHQKMQRVDAIKVIRPDRLTGVSFDTVKQMQHRFEREVLLAATFVASQQSNRSSESARRELWSMWIGHAVGSLACLTSLRIMFHPDPYRSFAVFYPSWAVITSVVFFAKSGNFWTAYRWIAAHGR